MPATAQWASRSDEDLQQNRFMRILQQNFESLYRRAAERGDSTTILVPCSEYLETGEGISQINQNFMETHILEETHIPDCFLNLNGRGVEIKDSKVCTQLGFPEDRKVNILQTESIYESDYQSSFRVLVVDQPLIGRLRPPPSSGNRGSKGGGGMSASPSSPADASTDWLNAAPGIQDEVFDEIDRFRRTFIQVAGCENSTAERIREIVEDATRKLMKHHKLNQSARRQLEYQVIRHVYAVLHSFIFPHLQNILEAADAKLENGVRAYNSKSELLDAIPGATTRGLGNIDLSRCSEQLAYMSDKNVPHEKITCIDEVYSELQKCVAEAGSQSLEGSAEITGDDVLSLFILTVYGSNLEQKLAHVAHVEMYLQSASGRSGGSANLEEAGYAVSTLQAALQFFLEERRPSTASRAPPRAISSIFSIYLQPGSEPDTGTEALQGLVRQARARR